MLKFGVLLIPAFYLNDNDIISEFITNFLNFYSIDKYNDFNELQTSWINLGKFNSETEYFKQLITSEKG